MASPGGGDGAGAGSTDVVARVVVQYEEMLASGEEAADSDSEATPAEANVEGQPLREALPMPEGVVVRAGAPLPPQWRRRAKPASKLLPPRRVQLRPRPPPAPLTQAPAVGDAVDAFHDDAWWEAIVEAVDTSAEGEARVTVKVIEEDNVETDIPLSQLRRTVQWNGAAFVPPSHERPAAAAAAAVAPYVVPEGFDAASAGLGADDVDASSKARAERTTGTALAARWAALRREAAAVAGAPPLERYTRGQHLRGADVALLERARAELVAAHGPALAALGIEDKDLLMWAKRTIRQKGLLPVEPDLSSDSGSDSEPAAGDADGDADAAAGRKRRRAAVRAEAKTRRQSAAGAGGRDDDEEDADEQAPEGEPSDDDDEDDEDDEAEDDGGDVAEEPSEEAGAAPGRGRGRGRGRGAAAGRGRGRGGGRGAGRAGGKGGASKRQLPAALEDDATPFAAVLKAAPEEAQRNAAVGRMHAETALARQNALATVSLCWSPLLLRGGAGAGTGTAAAPAAVLAAGSRGGDVALWRAAGGGEARCLGALRTAAALQPSFGAPGWASALAWAPPRAEGDAEAATLLAAGGVAGDVAFWRADAKALAVRCSFVTSSD